MISRETLAEAFVQLADTGDDAFDDAFDEVGFLQRLGGHCVELAGADEAGLLVAGTTGPLTAAAATGDRGRLLAELQLRTGEGPGIDCHRSGRVVEVDDLSDADEVGGAAGRWPRFTPACRLAGFGSVHAIPMHRRELVIGAVVVFGTVPGPLDPPTARVLRSLADLATIVLVHQRAARRQHSVIGQLQEALTSRVVIEQAKGVLAERTGLSPDEAFDAMRGLARTRNLGLTALARDVIAGTVGLSLPRPQRGGHPPMP